jgi:hypothetical protein
VVFQRHNLSPVGVIFTQIIVALWDAVNDGRAGIYEVSPSTALEPLLDEGGDGHDVVRFDEGAAKNAIHLLYIGGENGRKDG